MIKTKEKRYSKLMIILFFIFMAAVLLFTIEVVRFIGNASKSIEMGSRDIACESLNYRVNVVSYTNKQMVIEFISESYHLNISKLTIIPDQGGAIIKAVEPPLEGTGSRFLKIENIDINKNFLIYPEECITKKQVKELSI